MTPRSALETKGEFFSHPFAELLAEISQNGLNGSLRTWDQEKKCAVYFRAGRVVLAASNARSSRLFDILIRRGKITKEEVVKIPNFSNDFELIDHLTKAGSLTTADRDSVFREQIESILVDLLGWSAGEWVFSPLARAREGLAFEIDNSEKMLNYGRCLKPEIVLARFRSIDETFRRSSAPELGLALTQEEGFILSRIEDPVSIAEIISLSTMSQDRVLQILYPLWLAGLILRDNWNPAFSRSVVASIKAARLELKAPSPRIEPSVTETRPAAQPPEKKETAPSQKPAETVISLAEYLDRVENAPTYYDILGVDAKADTDELKRAYLNLAKNFHPDRFRSETAENIKRIQHAFTELANAHETLKSPESREVYDYRARKEIADRKARAASGESGTEQRAREQATENFDRGFGLLMENDVDAALPFLARAAHLSPRNSRYRAYYGRALAFDEKQRHKAESEMQSAIKLDPNNATFRIMLAEFFIQYNLFKRAEGELNRLLAIFPSNREARELLDGLRAKAR